MEEHDEGLEQLKDTVKRLTVLNKKLARLCKKRDLLDAQLQALSLERKDLYNDITPSK